MATWIILRGLTRETAHWGSFPQYLGHVLPDARIIALDLPGNGTLHQQRSPLNIAALVEFCRFEMARLGLAPPYHLLAMSMGAMVAAQWACEVPQEVAAAVLINTSFRPFNPVYQRLRPANWGTLLRLALLPLSPENIERSVMHMTSQRGATHADELATWIHVRRQRPVQASNALRQLLCAARFIARHQPPEVPVLLLGSRLDQLVDVQCTLRIAQHWGCSMALHTSAGHDLPLDDPQWVVQQVHHWLVNGTARSNATVPRTPTQRDM